MINTCIGTLLSVSQAIDNGLTRRHTETSVEVIVEDVNDNSPTFSQAVYEIKMSEDVQPGEMVGTQSHEYITSLSAIFKLIPA